MPPRKDPIPHETRTAAEPRQNKLYPVRLAHIEQINPTIRLLRLALPAESLSDDETDDLPQEPFSFLPGQWLDVHVPGIQQAGGFTITSTPSDAHPLPTPDANATVIQEGSNNKVPSQHVEISADSNGRYPYVELAVQNSPSNPPAAWLWKPTKEILGREVNVRVGGSFVWPPAATILPPTQINKVVLVAGGVGINPLISILSHITELASTPCSPQHQQEEKPPHTKPPTIHFLYTTRIPHAEKLLLDGKLSTPQASITREALDEILFLSRLRRIVHRVSSCSKNNNMQIKLDVFLTNIPPRDDSSPSVLAQATQSLNEDGGGGGAESKNNIHVHGRRISKQDLDGAVVGAAGGESTVCYVCGPPPMTDEFVGHLGSLIGSDRVLCEKWW